MGVNFNCTIQELKHLNQDISIYFDEDFNCTIQELKPCGAQKKEPMTLRFQLHHTGIKTLQL